VTSPDIRDFDRFTTVDGWALNGEGKNAKKKEKSEKRGF